MPCSACSSVPGVILAFQAARCLIARLTLRPCPYLVRTFVTLLTTLSMLHLSLVGGDLACASHETAGRAMPGMVMEGPSHEAASAMAMDAPAGSPAQASAQPAKDCAAPSQGRCCEAMTSCGLSTTASVVERLVSESLPPVATPRLPTAVLESVLAAPEPPPPKA